jgi:hypothetical protein
MAYYTWAGGRLLADAEIKSFPRVLKRTIFIDDIVNKTNTYKFHHIAN